MVRDVMVRDQFAGRHVVVVDDDVRLLALARLALQKQGIRVSTAATAEEGRQIVADDPPDLVILDIVLPDMSGWEVLRRIRETDDCLVMLLSGRDSDIDKARGLDLGADDYVTKPFSFLEFEARVRALLRRAPAREHDGGQHAGSTDTESVSASFAEIDRAGRVVR
jgi:DNA-binding response OmpR family regulator